MSPREELKSGRRSKEERKLVRTFSASRHDLAMLEAIAHYHGFSKSATITSLLKKEFWRIFPQGTETIRPDPGARVLGEER
jgi:hypothetical protein